MKRSAAKALKRAAVKNAVKTAVRIELPSIKTEFNNNLKFKEEMIWKQTSK